MRTLLLATTLLLFLSPSLAHAQTGSSRPVEAMPGYKSPGTATLIAVAVPGGGHIYAGETATGLGTLFVSGAAVSVGALYSSCYDSESGRRCNYVPLYIGLGVHTGNWLLSLFDADNAARRHNRREGLVARTRLRPTAAPHGAELAYGLRLTVSL